uniref:Uncharacterized protein n=1 Tax=Toxoplasma gondii COUG TaxID=1074873 RepID=A0A2G8XSJ3_TOXGO|nr:hypothetical protein TGCOUG_253970 [Toxoplasma gondii COUG]
MAGVPESSPGRGVSGFSPTCMRLQGASSSLLSSLLASPSWHFVENGNLLYPASSPEQAAEEGPLSNLAETPEAAKKDLSERSPALAAPPGCTYTPPKSSASEEESAVFLSVGPVTLASQLSLRSLEGKQSVGPHSKENLFVPEKDCSATESLPVLFRFLSSSAGVSNCQGRACEASAASALSFRVCSVSLPRSDTKRLQKTSRSLPFPAGACVCACCGELRSSERSVHPRAALRSPLRQFAFIALHRNSFLPLRSVLPLLRAHRAAMRTGRNFSSLAPVQQEGEGDRGSREAMKDEHAVETGNGLAAEREARTGKRCRRDAAQSDADSKKGDGGEKERRREEDAEEDAEGDGGRRFLLQGARESFASIDREAMQKGERREREEREQQQTVSLESMSSDRRQRVLEITLREKVESGANAGQTWKNARKRTREKGSEQRDSDPEERVRLQNKAAKRDCRMVVDSRSLFAPASGESSEGFAPEHSSLDSSENGSSKRRSSLTVEGTSSESSSSHRCSTPSASRASACPLHASLSRSSPSSPSSFSSSPLCCSSELSSQTCFCLASSASPPSSRSPSSASASALCRLSPSANLRTQSFEPMRSQWQLGVAICLADAPSEETGPSDSKPRHPKTHAAAASDREASWAGGADLVDLFLQSALEPCGWTRNWGTRSEDKVDGGSRMARVPGSSKGVSHNAAQGRRERILYTLNFVDFDVLRTHISFKKR